ncbi:rRNA N-glycosidase [Rhynchospora pubera]|uniref:rRNA N-glycosidase n=1 Tax=Rhynchospora pubera TaxID=906938 RepID=A0AAV8F433_9POAL|nr:rRNA N-glycosidase [Rhynchospora pubera]
MASKSNPAEKKADGRSIAEIFEVRLLEIRGKSCGSIHGKLTVVTGGGDFRIFDRPDASCAHRISSKELIPIDGPFRAISGLGDVGLRIKLKEGEKKIIHDIIFFDQFRDKKNVVVTKRSMGPGASLEMKLAVYQRAVVANVEIRLISGKNGTGHSGLYGKITASNSLLPHMEILLFYKKREDYVEIDSCDLIPLCRSVTAGPAKERLRIYAHLYDVSGGYLVIGDVSYVIPEYLGSDVNYIKGKHGQNIEVKVIWEEFWPHVRRKGAYSSLNGQSRQSEMTDLN